MEMREDVLGRVGREELDKNGYHVSDLEDIDFHCEDHDLNIDTIIRFGIDTDLFPQNSTISIWVHWWKTR